MWRLVLRARVGLLFALFCLGAPGMAQGATPQNTPGVTDLIRDRQDRLLEEQQRRLEGLKDLPGKAAPPTKPTAPVEPRCFPIKTIELTGADALSEGERDSLLKPYIGQCLGVPQLNELLKVITDRYLEKGLVTSRAYLPQQDLSSGNLKVQVVEGRLEGMKGAEGSGITDRQLFMSFPGKPGDLLNLREIEQMLYMAQSNNRLAPNGALIQGTDLTMIAGKNLTNAGTLKATNNLSAIAGQDMVSSGLMQAGGRLDLLASKDLTNKAGGVIAGKDVALTALTGDVTNERTVTSSQIAYGKDLVRNDYVDSAARVESANDLNISAGRDINNIGGALQSGRDVILGASRDVNIASAQATNSLDRGVNRNSSNTTQYSASLSAGRDVSVQAGRDVTVVAGDIDAERNISVKAAENLTLSSSADESHSYSKSKKLTTQEDHVKQIASNVTAGGDVVFSAGKGMTLVSSRINAGDEAYLVAGGQLDLLAGQRLFALRQEKEG